MPRKKIEPITGLDGKEDKLTVQKSLPLFSLWRSQLSLSEFKILDTYLSRINSHIPEKRTVVFEKGELEQLLGVDRIRTEELDKRLVHLGTPIRIDDATAKNKKFSRISLFEKAAAEQDSNGIWRVELTASQSAMKYFFNVENLGYLRYKLRCITSLNSRYAYIMFTYLESNRYRREWTVALEDLKHILSCEKEEYAREFKYFNRDVLKRIQKELHEKTECRYTYTSIKKGRSVVAIHFRVEPLNAAIEDSDQIPGQLSISSLQDHELWEDALADSGFSPEQMEHIRTLIEVVSPLKLPDTGNGIDIDRFHYMRQLWAKLNAQSQKKRITNTYAYLCSMIAKDQ